LTASLLFTQKRELSKPRVYKLRTKSRNFEKNYLHCENFINYLGTARFEGGTDLIRSPYHHQATPTKRLLPKNITKNSLQHRNLSHDGLTGLINMAFKTKLLSVLLPDKLDLELGKV
jgi:hypothetical protein